MEPRTSKRRPDKKTPPFDAEPRPPGEAAEERTLITTQDFVDYYLSEGRRLLRQGIEPGQPAAAYIRAFPGLSAFLRQHGEVLAERGVVSAEIEAGEALLGRLGEADQRARDRGPGSGRGEAIGEASGKLSQVRDSVRRLTRGAEGAEVRRIFGLDHKVDSASVASLLHGIELFLDGGRRLEGRLRSFRLIPADLLQLADHRQKLLALRTPADPDPGAGSGDERLSAEAQALRLSVENYFASLAAAITTAFAEGDPRRIAGLKLIPRHEERRERPPTPTRPLPRLWRPLLPTTDE
jgi:hypothetical protein